MVVQDLKTQISVFVSLCLCAHIHVDIYIHLANACIMELAYL